MPQRFRRRRLSFILHHIIVHWAFIPLLLGVVAGYLRGCRNAGSLRHSGFFLGRMLAISHQRRGDLPIWRGSFWRKRVIGNAYLIVSSFVDSLISLLSWLLFLRMLMITLLVLKFDGGLRQVLFSWLYLLWTRFASQGRLEKLCGWHQVFILNLFGFFFVILRICLLILAKSSGVIVLKLTLRGWASVGVHHVVLQSYIIFSATFYLLLKIYYNKAYI